MHHYLFTATYDQRNENLDPMFYVQYPLLKTSGITALKILIRCVIHKTPSKDGVNKTPYFLYSIHVPLFNFLNDVTGQVCPAPMLPKKEQNKTNILFYFLGPFPCALCRPPPPYHTLPVPWGVASCALRAPQTCAGFVDSEGVPDSRSLQTSRH